MAKKGPERRYWDAAAFLAYLREEKGRVDACEQVLSEAERGRIIILTSALTLAEVVRLKGQPRLEKDKEETINRFFQNGFIRVRPLDRLTAEYSRHLLWKYNKLMPKDSVHVATAIRSKNLNLLETYDAYLIGLSGQIGEPSLTIREPSLGQGRLFE